MNEHIRNLPTYPMIELARRKAELVARGVDVLDFGTGDPQEATAPFIREALAAAIPEVSQYPSIRGSTELRAAFSAWYAARFGVELDPETEILPTRGSKEAMFHLPLVLVDPDDAQVGAVYPEPGYPVMQIGSLYAGATTEAVPLTAENGYLMDPVELPESVLASARIVWLNYPHNPTGTDLPESLWRAWVEASREHEFVLCSDECYTELYFGERPRSLLEFGRERCLIFHSLSKRSGLTGYRSGILAGDAELIALYQRHRAAMGQANTIFVDQASAAAWRDEAHVAERRAAFRAKRERMLAGLAERGLSVHPSTSTFYLWVRAPEGHTGDSYASHLLDHGLVVSPGSMFGEGNEDWFRIALVPDLAGCEQALERWPA